MPNANQSATVIGKDGLSGVMLDPLPSHPGVGDSVRIRLDDGRVISIPADSVVVGSDGTCLIPIGPSDLSNDAAPAREQGKTVVPVLSEELVIEKKPVPTGGVRVNRRVTEHDEVVEVPLTKEHVDVRRVIVDREVDGPLPVRREGDVTIVPIVEEVLVVQKHFRLKEEIHITKTSKEEVHRERVTLQRQEADIERVDAEGRRETVRPAQVPQTRARTQRRRSILSDD